MRTQPPMRPGFPPLPMRLPIDHVVLLDAVGLPLAPALPLGVEREVVVPMAVLTNDIEDRALLIPVAPLQADSYTWTWSLDRPRFRSAIMDDTVRYRTSATWMVTLAG